MATVDLTWTDNASSEDGFYVYRSTTSSPTFNNGSGDYTQIADLSADTTSYTDSNAPYDTTVYYAVTAYNTDGESGETTDSVVTNLSVTVNGNDISQITVNSTEVTSIEINGSPI